MHQKKSKKIFIYIILFLIIGTFTHKDLENINFNRQIKINISGLDKENNFKLLDKLNFLKLSSLLFLNKHKIIEVMDSNDLIEKYSVFKKYPSTLKIKIDQTKFLAQMQINNNNFLLGSNGRFIKTNTLKEDLPFIFGNFNKEKFFQLKKAIDETDFDYNNVRNLFFFKSGRWDIETNNGLLIKLPEKEIKNSLVLFLNFYAKKGDKKINKIDLRQLNQIITNE